MHPVFVVQIVAYSCMYYVQNYAYRFSHGRSGFHSYVRIEYRVFE